MKPAADDSDSKYYCPFSKKPDSDCYCASTSSLNASLAIQYCGGTFERCVIYKRKISNREKNKKPGILLTGLLLIIVSTLIVGCASKKPPVQIDTRSEISQEEIARLKQELEEKKREIEKIKKKEELRRIEAEARKKALKDSYVNRPISPVPALPKAPRANEGDELKDDEALKDIYFTLDKSNIGNDARKILYNTSEWLLKNPDKKVLIEGHCDERGTSEYNISLGERRALSTKRYLMTLGVSEDRLYTISYGEEMPIDSKHNEKAWSKNRRVHFSVISKQ